MNTNRAGASIFAHLGRGPKAAGSEEEKDDKEKDAKKAGAEEGGEDDGEKTDDKAKGKKAKAEDQDGDGKTDDEPKGKKAKKASDEDEDADQADEDDENDTDAKAARGRERRRIRAILVSEPGKANPVAAAHLATGTSMPRNQAIEMLAAMQAGSTQAAAGPAPAASRDTLRTRMAEVPNANVGTEEDRPAPNLADQIVAAGKRRRGEA